MWRLLREYNIMPRECLALDTRTKAFLIACCLVEDDMRNEGEK